MRRHIADYGTTLQTKPLSIDTHTQYDLNTKYATLLVYDLEAAIRLAHYADITTIVTLQRPLRNILACKAMGDVLLQSSAPPEGIAPDPLLNLVSPKKVSCTNKNSSLQFTKAYHQRNTHTREV